MTYPKINNETKNYVKKSFNFFNDKKEFSLKRNYLFLKDFKYYFKYLFTLMKNLKKHIAYLKHINFLIEQFNFEFFKPFIFFIASKKDFFFYKLFEAFTEYYNKISFLIEWNASRFFYFLNKKKTTWPNFYPIIIISPVLLDNIEFMKILNFLYNYPIFFFIEKISASSYTKFHFYKSVIPVFLYKKNNFTSLLLFFKLFIKFLL